MPSLSVLDLSRVNPALSGLRRRAAPILHAHPGIDPSRSMLSNFPATALAIEQRQLFTVPSVLFEAIPATQVQYMGAAVSRIWSRPSATALSDKGAKEKSSVLALRLGAALFRILSALDACIMEPDQELGLALPTIPPDALDPNAHWLSSAAPTAGHTSPSMRMHGRIMTVAEALMHLSYPSRARVQWHLRRRCSAERCVNPWHYLAQECHPVTAAQLTYLLAVPPGHYGTLPLPYRNPLDGRLDWTGGWTQWEAMCCQALEAYRPTGAQAPPEPSAPEAPTLSEQAPSLSPDDVFALVAGAVPQGN